MAMVKLYLPYMTPFRRYGYDIAISTRHILDVMAMTKLYLPYMTYFRRYGHDIAISTIYDTL